MNRQQQEIIEARKSSSEYLKQACKDANATIEVGNDTSSRLQKQGEQMDGMSRSLDHIEYELKVSDKIVKTMSSWGGMVSGWFSSDPKPVKSKPEQPQSSVKAARPAPGSAGKAKKSEEKTSTTTENTSTLGLTQEEDMLLDQLSNNLHVMRGQAHLHRDIIAEQNKKLDELAEKNDKVRLHMQKTDKNVRKML